MQKNIITWALTALVLSLGFGQLLRFEFYGLPLYLHDLLVLGILVLYGHTAKLPRTFPPGLKFFLFGLALGYLRALTLYPLSDLLIPSLYALRLLAYLALYLSLHRTITISSTIFLLSGLISLVIGLAQYFLMPDMRLFFYLGWDDHLNRLILPHFDPTFSGAMLTMYLIFLMTAPKSLSSFLFTASSLVAILLTYSRSIWLAIILTLTATRKKLFLPLLAVFAVAVILLPKRFGEGNNLLRTYSITSRFYSDLSYFSRYKWDLLVGRGFNTLMLDSGQTLYPSHASSPNNSYLYLLATTGVLGLVGWGTFLAHLYRNSSRRQLFLFLAFASLFNNVMFYPFTLLLLLIAESITVPT